MHQLIITLIQDGATKDMECTMQHLDPSNRQPASTLEERVAESIVRQIAGQMKRAGIVMAETKPGGRPDRSGN